MEGIYHDADLSEAPEPSSVATSADPSPHVNQNYINHPIQINQRMHC